MSGQTNPAALFMKALVDGELPEDTELSLDDFQNYLKDQQVRFAMQNNRICSKIAPIDRFLLQFGH
jgi:hypothetical protein